MTMKLQHLKFGPRSRVLKKSTRSGNSMLIDHQLLSMAQKILLTPQGMIIYYSLLFIRVVFNWL